MPTQTTSLPQTIYRKNYQPPIFLIEKVELSFDITETITTVKSKLHCQRNLDNTQKLSDLILDGENLKLIELMIDGEIIEEKKYNLTDKQLIISELPDKCVIEITVNIDPKSNTSLNGLYRSRNYFCTQCEPEGFHHITYFPDRPDVMAKFTTTIIADKEQYPTLLSNGNLVASGELSEKKHWVRFEDPFKKPCYLFALVACDMDCLDDTFVTRSGHSVNLKIFVEQGNLPQAKFAMQALKKSMAWDEVVFDREYDLDIYMIVAVSDFNMGAMENKGLNIFNDKYILATEDRATDQDFLHVELVIAHEYFHNWSGNRVTCRDWFQLSLKEGLTIFREQLFTADMTSQTVSRIDEVDYMRTIQFSEDSGPLSHAVRPDSYIEINNFYTSTVYNKGAEVIRMLRMLIGEEKFRLGMNLYFERHDGQAVTIEDFVRAHEEIAEIDLTQFRIWYSQSGTPRITVTDFYQPEKQSYALTFKQICQQPLHIPILMGLLDENGVETHNELLELRAEEQTFTFENIAAKPIPSLLRQFSAPVYLDYDYSDNELDILFNYDPDEFNRREAGFRLAVKNIFRLINKKSVPEQINKFLAGCQNIFQTLQYDRWLLTRMLVLPSEKYLAEQMPIIDIDGIHAAREFLAKSISLTMKDDFLATWQELNQTTKSSALDIESMANRALKNLCLHYLLLLDDKVLQREIGLQQFEVALGHNMTDTMAAFSSLINIPELREQVLQMFYQRWHDNPLVLDKWFAIQASAKSSDTLERVKALTQHPAFDILNPNKVYALIGSFGANAVQFHQKSGAGYQFLAEVIIKLDKFNPQVASRMVKPLVAWKRFDNTRQILMRNALDEIAQTKNLSNDVYEVVTKSLNIEEKI